jgi:hypothetical protein
LASLELQAASDALEKCKEAADWRGQMWSVINHLETAEAALCRAVTKNTFIRELLRGISRSADISDLFKVRLLMAAGYVYLGQKRLALKLLGRAEECYELIREGNFVATVLSAYSGLIFIDAILASGREILYPSDIDTKLKSSVESLRRTVDSPVAKRIPVEGR